MKKNLIIRKRHLLTIPMLLMIMCFSGCGPQLTVETYTHEAGEELPEDAAAYADFKDSEKANEAIVDVSAVNANAVGTYEATITLKNKEYPFSVEVVDTTAPEGTLKQHFIATAGEISAEIFTEGTKDASEFTEGIRNFQLMYDEEQVRELIELEVGENNISEMQFDMDKIFGTNWKNDETHFWEEKDLSADDLEEVIVPDADGVYSLEVVAVDIYGNASVAKVYAMVDTKAPVFTKAEDIEVVVDGDFTEFLEAQREGLEVEDNLLGNMTTAVYEDDMEFENSKNTAMKITYAVNDFAGNISSATRKISVASKKKTAVGSIYGPKLTQAELDEVDAAVQNFLNQYITPGMTDYQKVRAANDFLCNTVSYADSWAYNGANTAWGALIYHEAQCSGYARAMKALCDGMGIGCYYVHADASASNPSHQWNEVCVDGNWYIVDVQANDEYNNIAFLVSENFYVSTFGMSWDRSSVPACPSNY